MKTTTELCPFREFTKNNISVLRLPLPIREEQLYLFYIGLVNYLALSDRSLTFPRLFGQNMVSVRFAIHKFAGSGFLKTLCRRTICFYFRHFFIFSLNIEKSGTVTCLSYPAPLFYLNPKLFVKPLFI